jgi:hypothetical protein
MPYPAQEGERDALTREAARQVPRKLGRRVQQNGRKLAPFRIEPHLIVREYHEEE